MVQVILVWLVAHGAFGERLLLPLPPEQAAPWVAPDSTPTNLLSAAVTLFAQGFPDPRGCEFRHLTVEVSGVWGEPRGYWGGTSLDLETKAHSARTTGWLLPVSGSQTQRFAICWNGLIYPVAELGTPADLSAEAANPPRAVGRFPYYFGGGEIRSVFSTNAGSSRLLLLLRSGRTEAALAHWKLFDQPQSSIHSIRSHISGVLSGYTDTAGLTRITPSKAPAELGNHGYDPYLDFAGDWAWALFDRAICAHMRGDEALALATTRTLSEVQPRIEAEAARRGFPRQRYYDSARRNQEKPYLDFLERLPQLLADLERREHEGVRVPILQRGLTNLPTASERIAALIRDLDLVAARQWEQPGGVDLVDDAVVAALIAVGDPAVPALMDCLATDQRLTRSVSFGRDFFRQRNVIPVSAAARAALQAILQTDLPTVAGWRAYWQRFHDMRIEDRWFTLLQDDNAGMACWLETASTLTRPENERTVLLTGFGSRTVADASSNAPPRLRGEWLRAKTHPSVAELLTRRALEITPANAATYDLVTAGEIALRLAAWDAAAAGPVAVAWVRRWQTVTEYSDASGQRSWSQQSQNRLFIRLTMARARTDEAGALRDYAAWLRTVSPQSLGPLPECLEPLMIFATNTLMQSISDDLFSETNSAWGKLPWTFAGSFNPITSSLLSLPAFRQLLLRELNMRTVCGHWEWRPGMASYQMTNNATTSGAGSLALPPTEQPAAGTKVELRWCDWVLFNLAQAKVVPPFNPFTSSPTRDLAIEFARTRLRTAPGAPPP